MTIDVYPFPPVGIVAFEWTFEQPIAVLRSLTTVRSQAQASQPKRRLATVQVSALGNGGNGAGYCEMLKELLEGGANAVRLSSFPANSYRGFVRAQSQLNSEPLAWRTGGQPLAWRVGSSTSPLQWFTREPVIGGTPGTSGGYNTLPLTGLPSNTLIARPADYIRVYAIGDANTSEIARVLAPCVSNGAGAATLRLDRPITIVGGRVNLAAQDEAVFVVDADLPRAVQPVSGDWIYSWAFREVFADEVGGFVEKGNPWL